MAYTFVSVYDSNSRFRRALMSRELEELVAKVRKIEMTPEQLREQRRSFVYGNTYIENERITRELIAKVDEELSASDS